jgi:hypothetical protein
MEFMCIWARRWCQNLDSNMVRAFRLNLGSIVGVFSLFLLEAVSASAVSATNVSTLAGII